MSAPTPLALYQALETQLLTITDAAAAPAGGPLRAVSRKWSGWAQTNPEKTPTVYLVTENRTYRPEEGIPTVKVLNPVLIVYAMREGRDDGDQQKPLADAIAAIEQALAPDDPERGTFTLGGLCSHCVISGEVDEVQAGIDAWSVGMLPIEILMNQDDAFAGRRFVFGSGDLWATVTAAQGSRTAVTPAPSVRLASLREVSVEVEDELKLARTGSIVPVNPASGKRTVRMKARFAAFEPVVATRMFWQAAPAAGGTFAAEEEGVVPTLGVTAFAGADQMKADIAEGSSVSKSVTVPSGTNLVALCFVNDEAYNCTAKIGGVSMVAAHNAPPSAVHGHVLVLNDPPVGVQTWQVNGIGSGMAASLIFLSNARAAALLYTSQAPDATDFSMTADTDGSDLVVNWTGDTSDDKAPGAGETTRATYVMSDAGYSAKASTKPVVGATTDVAWDGNVFTANSQIAVGAAPGTFPTLTPTPPLAGTWADDLGVLLAGTPMTRVTGDPDAGEYRVAAGVYTFSPDDSGEDVAIAFLYTTSSGTSLAVGNPAGGYATTFRAVLRGVYNGKQMTAIFNRCVASKLSVPFELEKFSVQGLEFEAIADLTAPNGNVGTISVL